MKIKTDIKAGQGLGDTVADLTRITRVDQLAKLYEDVTGKPCGCDQRRALLNQIQLPSLS
jgi:hypothetical protein